MDFWLSITFDMINESNNDYPFIDEIGDIRDDIEELMKSDVKASEMHKSFYDLIRKYDLISDEVWVSKGFKIRKVYLDIFEYDEKKEMNYHDHVYTNCKMLKALGDFEKNDWVDKIVVGQSLTQYSKNGVKERSAFTDPGLRNTCFRNLLSFREHFVDDYAQEESLYGCVMLRDTDKFKKGEKIECMKIEGIRYFLSSDDGRMEKIKDVMSNTLII